MEPCLTHDDVVLAFTARRCPFCELEEELESAKDKVRDLEEKVESLESEKSELQEEIEALRSAED